MMIHEALESGICDVIKIHLKRGMEGEAGKETPKKRDECYFPACHKF